MRARLLHWLVRDFKPIQERDKGDVTMAGFYQDIHRRGGDQLYMRRHFIWKKFGISIFLHWFVTKDQDDWVHDHPWRFCVSFILAGKYLEERVRYFDPIDGPVLKRKWVRFFNWLLPSTFHRVAQAAPETWTLFIHFGRIKEWGFFEKQVHPQRKGDDETELVPTHCIVYYQPYLHQYLERAKERRGES